MSRPQPTHQYLASTVLTGACRFRHAFRRQSQVWSKELSLQCREAAASLNKLRQQDRKTAIHKLGASLGCFLRDTFVHSPAQFLRQRQNKRVLCFMLVGLLPLIAASALLALPAMLFNLPEHRAYFFFARFLQSDAASLIPVLLGIISLVVVLRFPLSGHRGGGLTC